MRFKSGIGGVILSLVLGGTNAHACFSPPSTHAIEGTLTTLPSDQAFARKTIYVSYYQDLSDRYAHGVLGDALEPTSLAVKTMSGGGDCPKIIRVTLDDDHVFEDIAPRLHDLDGDLNHEVIVVRSHRQNGAQLAVYGLSEDLTRLELIATTPYIGRANRWLAPLGAADLDGDGAVEVAYIDRPHLAKTLRIWRYRNGALEPVAEAPGLTNHRIGWDYITGGIRDCGTGPEIVTASGNWRRLMAARLVEGQIVLSDLGHYSPEGEAAALDCVPE